MRLDSFVYTVEGLREARARLRGDGVVSLSFAVLSKLGRKIYLMMQQAFDGHPPVCVYARYDGSVIFLQSKDGRSGGARGPARPHRVRRHHQRLR